MLIFFSRRNTRTLGVLVRLPLFLCCLLFAGCGDPNELEVARVSGVVKLDGEPLSGGAITFTPEKGPMANGSIGADGSFVLQTYGGGDGAVVGLHGVAIVVTERGEVFENDEPAKWIVPSEYASAATSGIEFEVKSGTDNVTEFNLSKLGPNSDK